MDSLIVRSLENCLLPEEQASLQAWLAEDETHLRYYETYRSTWTLTGQNNQDYHPDVTANWERFRQRILHDNTPALSAFKRSPWLRIAASVIAIAGAALIWFTLTGPREVTEITGNMERKTITLPDGSKVYMNQHSRLHYARQLAGAERAVYLEGEAFFEVAPKVARPFVVYASHTQTQVLGTSFDVKAYETFPVEVSVVTGKVAVSRKTQSLTAENKIVLTPGRKATFSADKQPEEQVIAEPNFIAWKEHRLIFENVRVSDAVKTLEAYYGVHILITDTTIAG